MTSYNCTWVDHEQEYVLPFPSKKKKEILFISDATKINK